MIYPNLFLPAQGQAIQSCQMPAEYPASYAMPGPIWKNGFYDNPGILKEDLKPALYNTPYFLQQGPLLNPAAHALLPEKHKDFLVRPIMESELRDIAGIGKAYERRLRAKGYKTAGDVFYQFVLVNGERGPFIDRMQKDCGAKKHHAALVYHALSEYSSERAQGFIN